MITDNLKVVSVSTNKNQPNLILVEMTQQMYQYICYKLLIDEHNILVQKKIEELKNK